MSGDSIFSKKSTAAQNANTPSSIVLTANIRFQSRESGPPEKANQISWTNPTKAKTLKQAKVVLNTEAAFNN